MCKSCQRFRCVGHVRGLGVWVMSEVGHVRGLGVWVMLEV